MKRSAARLANPRSRRLRCLLAAAAVAVSLPAYAFCAPFDAPETKGAIPGSVVLDAHGTVLQRDGNQGFKIPVGLAAVAPIMRDATIAAEDQRFEHHPGIDPIAIARAVSHIGSQRSGASTITQQLARRLYLPGGGGPLPLRKARESLIALQLEAHRSKDEILALYLNDVYYGRGAYGVEAAARVYFGVSALNLDLAQAAYLAGLPQLPSAYDSAGGESAALTRQAYVLGRMLAGGRISHDQAEAARTEPLDLLPALEPALAPHFVSYALDELARTRPDLAARRGLVIETTLDAGLQRESERLMRLHLEDLTGKNVTNGAVVVVEPGSGRILAMVGSAAGDDPDHGGQINMAVQPRQPGSALKPFLYAAAFEHGFTPATALLDVPTTFTTNQGPYSPMNFDRSFHGVVPLRTALASSFNVPAVRTLDTLGIDALLEIAHRFGLRTLTDADSYGLSLTLGGGEVRLLDLTAAYAALGAGGAYAEPFAITRVRDSHGRVLYERPPSAARAVVSAEHAYLLADILSDPSARIPGFGQVTPFDLPFRAAVKTGTTTGFRDNWTLGFTPELAVGVWVGNADGSPMHDVSGVDGAGPVWRDVMMAAALGRRLSWPPRPAGIVEATVCSPTGLLPGPACPSPIRELFVAGTVPAEQEQYYVRDESGRVAINPPMEALAWARDAGFATARDAPDASGGPIRIVQPATGSVFFMAPELREQQLVLRASAPAGSERVTFRLDGRVIGEGPGADVRLVWRLEPGMHRVEATARLADGSTTTATSTYEVKSQ
jgi:penicillin-binding protein 1C